MKGSLLKPDDDAGRLAMHLLDGATTTGVNLDSLHNTTRGWILIEFAQCSNGYHPYDSHPNRYWHKPGSRGRFLAQWRIKTIFDHDKPTQWFLVNYEATHTYFRVLRIVGVNENGVVTDFDKRCTFKQVQRWFRAIHAAGTWE